MTHAYTWDADGNNLSTDGTAVTVIYDALDRMIEQTRGSAHTQIVYGPYGMKLALMNGQALVNAFVKLPGGARAVYGSSGLAYYRHADHLGSSRLATTPSRTKFYDVAYAPYGEDYNGSGTQDPAFTDQNQDTVKGGWSTNLYDFMFREYRPAHGRWTSPDPAGLSAVDPTNPQSWNRNQYVLNNPLASTDPLGLVQHCTTFQIVFWTSTGVDQTAFNSYYAGSTTYTLCWDDGTTGNEQIPGVGNTAGGGGGAGGAANNGQQPKSPARQQCEANAQQKYQDSINESHIGALKAAAVGIWAPMLYDLGRGCVEGALATSETGPGALGGCVGGALIHAGAHAGTTLAVAAVATALDYGESRISASLQLRNDLAACAQIP